MILDLDKISLDSIFTINKFLFYQLDEETAVIQTATGITKVFDNRMIELIKTWEENYTESVSYSDLELLFKNDTSEAIDYLEHYGIIELTKLNKTQVNGIKLLCNSNNIGNLLYETLNNKYGNRMSVNQIDLDQLEDQSLENNLLLVILNPYDKKNCEDITSETKKIYIIPYH
ncbi:hypothetical protein HMSSN139_06460 [Paenibacillus sp. HMSSN-139]|nr:hypothetical protein HMSSN139_06460 [Paenibacillus sp. HMSSN-139]